MLSSIMRRYHKWDFLYIGFCRAAGAALGAKVVSGEKLTQWIKQLSIFYDVIKKTLNLLGICFSILLFSSHKADAQITGIKIAGDTCTDISLALQAESTSSSPYFFWEFGDPARGSNDISHNDFGISINDFGVSINDFAISINDFGISINDFAISINDFGISINDFGISINDFGISINDFGVSINDFGISLNGNGISLNNLCLFFPPGLKKLKNPQKTW